MFSGAVSGTMSGATRWMIENAKNKKKMSTTMCGSHNQRTMTGHWAQAWEETDFGHLAILIWPIWANPILANPFLDLVCVMVGPRRAGPEGCGFEGCGFEGWGPEG